MSEELECVMLPRLVRARRYAEMSGITLGAQKLKRARGEWLEGREFVTAPDGKIMVDWRECDRWARGENR